MSSFEGVNIENITACGTNDFGSGMKTRLYFAPAEWFHKINIGDSSNVGPKNNFQNALLISKDDIEFKAAFTWFYIDVLIDESEVKTSFSGSSKRRKLRSSLDVFILGYRSKILGFLQVMKNEDLVFCIPTADNISLLIGNLRNFATFDKAEGSTGKKYEENSGFAVSISANSPTYFFKENLIIETPGNGSGTGTGGFIDLTQDY